ncbi:PAN2-PAN3 deadenylation complex subunit pan3 at C-terminar half [Coccomyxa sp. Obi]|nr:PAN2-PAN3 deadenylation complex subunit pan3 at C-terminar half [Coccomyxa sp. Obi]
MSDAKDVRTKQDAGGDIQSRSSGLALDAPPFVPKGSQEQRPGLTLSSNVNAAPFVPASYSAANQNDSGTARSARSQKLASAASAAPFVPSTSSNNISSSNSNRLAAMSSNAAPFVPKAESFSSPQSKATNGHAARSSSRSDLMLPDGDDLLGMTAHTPGELAQALSSRAPWKSTGLGGSDAAGAGTRLETSAPATTLQFGAPTSPPRALNSHGSGYSQGYVQSPSKGRAMAQALGGSGRGVSVQGRGRSGPDAGGRGRGRRALPAAGMQGGMGQGPAGQVPVPLTPYGIELTKSVAAAGYFADRLRPEERQRSYLTLQQVNPGEADWGLPEMVQHYHSLYPLEDIAAARDQPSQAFGISTILLKAVSSRDGQAYTLRRLDSRQVPPSAELAGTAQEIVQSWSPLSSHPNLNVPRASFISAEFEGGPALVLGHAFHPTAITLDQAHLQPTSAIARSAPPTEEQLWSYLVQLISAVRAAHGSGLLLRPASLLPSKILLTSPGRIRVGSLGVADVMAGEISSREELHALQRDDLTAVGRLLLVLACAGAPPSLDYVAASFSQGLTRTLSALLASSQGSAFASWQQVAAVMSEQLMAEVDRHQLAAEAAAMQVWKGAEDGRLLRVMVRLSSVLERPESETDPQWAETGDRYLLKLFRDFVLHQVREDGSPMLDWGHVVECLNKLDAGVPEKITLMSRDEASLLVVSYADLKRCLEGALAELRTRGSNWPQVRLDSRRR